MIPLLLTAGRMLATGAVRGAVAGGTRGAIVQSVKKTAVDAAKKKAGGLAKSFIKKKITNAKKVSTGKLLPRAKKGGGGDGVVRKKSSAIVKSPTSALQKNEDKEKNGEKQNQEESKPFNGDELIQELTTIKETLTKIKGVFGSNLANTLRNQRNQRILRSKQKASEKESDLEKKPEQKDGGKKLKIPKKKLSFLDMIWNFISNVFMGTLLNFLWSYLPQITKIFGDISKGMSNTWQVLRLGIITISVVCRKQIKFLAKLTAKIIGPSSRLIGRLLLKAGGLVERLFPRVGKIINDLIRGPLNALIRAGVGGSRGSAAGAGALQRSKPGTGGRPKVTGSGGGRAGGFDVRNPLRQRPKVTTSGGGRAGGFDVRNPLRQGPAVTTGMGGANKASKLVNRLKIFSKIFKRIPIVGALIGIGIDLALGESLGRATAGAAGAAIGSGVGLALGKGGALAVTLATGGIGILAAPIIIGASAFLGSAVGDWAGKQIYDKVTSGAKTADKAAPIEKMYAAGRLGGGSRSSRTMPSRNSGVQGKPSIATSKISPDVEVKAQKDVLKDEKSLERFKTLSSVFAGTPFIGQLLKLGIDIGMGADIQKTQTDAAAQDLGFTIGRAMENDEFTVPGLNKRIIGPLSKNLTEWAKKKIFNEVKSREGLFPSIEKSAEETTPTSTVAKPGEAAPVASLTAADLQTIKASSADKKAAAHLATLEATAPQHVADVYQVILNRAANQSGGIAAVITAREQFSPYSAAIFGTSADGAAAKKYGSLKVSKKELFELAGKPDGIDQLTKRFNAGNPTIAKQVLSDFEKNGQLSQSAKKFVGGAQYFMGYATRVSGERRRPDGGNYFRNSYGGGHGFNHHLLPKYAMGGNHQVTSSMGMRNLAISPGMHMGIDIAGTTGEPLQAFTDGTVEATSPPSPSAGYGNWVSWIDNKGIGHFYGHMNKPPSVRAGQKVKKGTVLGELGSTGNSSGPHLHWEAATNPQDTGRPKNAVLSRFNPLSKYNKESPFGGTIAPDGSVPSSDVASTATGTPRQNGESGESGATLDFTSNIIRGDAAVGGGSGTKGKIVEYLTGDPNSPNIAGKAYDRGGHGTPGNYHDHVAFDDRQTAIDAYKFFKSKNVKVTEFKGFDPVGGHAPNSYHYSGLAFDIPGFQWGGSGPVGEKDYAGSRKVRTLLNEFFGGNIPVGSGPVPTDVAQQPGSAPGSGQNENQQLDFTSHIIRGDPAIESVTEAIKHKPSYDQGGQQSIVMMPIPQGSGQQLSRTGGIPRSTPQISTGLNSKEVAALSVNQFYAAALYKM
jgi:murein DD-endopeptidase MepM/ murein hydrolase activator NlpD